jgi:hypothetical protein
MVSDPREPGTARSVAAVATAIVGGILICAGVILTGTGIVVFGLGILLGPERPQTRLRSRIHRVNEIVGRGRLIRPERGQGDEIGKSVAHPVVGLEHRHDLAVLGTPAGPHEHDPLVERAPVRARKLAIIVAVAASTTDMAAHLVCLAAVLAGLDPVTTDRRRNRHFPAGDPRNWPDSRPWNVSPTLPVSRWTC